MQADIPKQGPMYFPLDKVGATGDDPVFLLNRQNASSTSHLVNNSSTSLDSPHSATGDVVADKKMYTRRARILAILLILMSIVMFVAGVVNIIFTSNEIARLAGNAEPTVLRDPSIFIWVWATPGVWASIPPFVAGIALLLSRRTPKKLSSNKYNPGLPIELQNSQENYSNAPDAYRIFAVFSITFSLPVGLLLAILDVVVSVTLSPIPYAKVILPIIVALMAIIDFVLLLVAWYCVKDASDNEYQYIGSTYTIYETFEPLIGKEPPVINTLAAATPILATQQCCQKENSPIVIINQPPVAQPISPPINVMVEERAPPRRLRPRPRPMPVPVPVPVPVVMRPRPMLPLFNQQRYYPNQMYGPPPSGILGRPNAYRGMFLPSSGPGMSAYGSYGQYGQLERP